VIQRFGQGLAAAIEIMVLRIFANQQDELDRRHPGQPILVPVRGPRAAGYRVTSVSRGLQQFTQFERCTTFIQIMPAAADIGARLEKFAFVGVVVKTL
jgi:hypothetical protein